MGGGGYVNIVPDANNALKVRHGLQTESVCVCMSVLLCQFVVEFFRIVDIGSSAGVHTIAQRCVNRYGVSGFIRDRWIVHDRVPS